MGLAVERGGETPILGAQVVGDIHRRTHLDRRHQTLECRVQTGNGHQHPVDAKGHVERPGLRLQVDIGGALPHRQLQQLLHQLIDRQSALGVLPQPLILPFERGS